MAQPANQPETVKHLYPQHKNLSIKRSLRCRHCEHNVIKPEYNPSSIKYRIQHFASYHVPEIRFVKSDPLIADSNAFITLKIINPTIKDMTITIMDLPTKEEEKILIEEMRKTFDVSCITNILKMNSKRWFFTEKCQHRYEVFIDTIDYEAVID